MTNKCICKSCYHWILLLSLIAVDSYILQWSCNWSHFRIITTPEVYKTSEAFGISYIMSRAGRVFDSQLWPLDISMLPSSHGYFGRNLSPRKIVPNVEVETTNMSSSPVHTKSYVFRPKQIWPPALFTNLYTKYIFISSPLHQYIH